MLEDTYNIKSKYWIISGLTQLKKKKTTQLNQKKKKKKKMPRKVRM